MVVKVSASFFVLVHLQDVGPLLKSEISHSNFRNSEEYDMYFDPVETGKRIKEIREAKGLTQMAFSEKLNISRSYINKIEKGTKTASIDLLIEIAVYGGVSLDYLVLGQKQEGDQLKEKIRDLQEMLTIFEKSL